MKILEPIKIKEMKLKNRIGFAPWSGDADRSGRFCE